MTKRPAAVKNDTAKRPPKKRVYLRKSEPVLAAAERLFLSQGFAATSMQDVAAEAGVAKATVYSNFSSKEELFSAVVKRRAEKNMLDLSVVELRSGDLAADLLELACAFLRDIYSREQVELFQTVVSDARRFPELGRMMIEGAFAETHGQIMEYFEEKVASGDIAHADPRMAAEYFIAIIKAERHIPLVFNQPVDVDPRSIRTIASGAVDIFLNGVRHRRSKRK
jgi:TetR/AcrR family transcriptional regulator, mexJK operon transcriptional repressor